MKNTIRWIASWKRGSKPIHQVVQMTPDLARYLLANELFTRGNKPALAVRYAKHMKSGEFAFSGEPIILNHQRRMIDGHHRCLAVIGSGVTVSMLMVVGVDRNAVAYIDCGAVRSMSQRRGAANGKRANVTRDTVVVRMMQVDRVAEADVGYPQHRHVGSIPYTAITAFEERYCMGVDFAMELFKSRKAFLSNASTMAAVAKAYYHASDEGYVGGYDRLRNFGEVLTSGMPTDIVGDQPIIALREHLLNRSERNATHDQGIPIFLKSCYAIDQYMRGNRIKRVFKSKGDIFPLDKAAAEFAPDDPLLEQEVMSAIENTKVAAPQPD